MATGTIVLRPSSDITMNHEASESGGWWGSSADGWEMISEEQADDNSTYIYMTVDSTEQGNSPGNITESVFLLNTESLPQGEYQITEARLFSRSCKSRNGEEATCTCYFAVGNQGGNSAGAATDNQNLTSSYATNGETSASLVEDINSELQSGSFPQLSVTVETTGSKAETKDNDGYVRVTQIYLELDYETIEEEQSTESLYIKQNDSWVEYAKAYRKANGRWTEIPLTEAFNDSTNYVYGGSV